MQRIELLKTLALMGFIALGAAASHAGFGDHALIAQNNGAVDRPNAPVVIFVAHPDGQHHYILPHADLG
ncbi:hypothetical protein [Pseudodonghicola flavimaris]|uniref:Uncharacterized protein n=1 Tax=Pseudodonghicola flavimaris TaxID=3050036 RepID=A0ABT7F043_9RHOB|nr:hypothetical protein [Pseudodonghicola flavimaris]MDK3017870.1 hypothetical protein [Pseudodonghicola flavimaris]